MGATTETFDESVKFFYEHAGFSWDKEVETEDEGKLRCACELALAERWGRRAGVEITWVEDVEPWDSDIKNEDGTPYVPETVEGCVARLTTPGRTDELVESLWGIADATDDYRRVVAAELSLDMRVRVTDLYRA